MTGFPVNLILGPLVIGAFFATFFFGLICMQTISYLKRFPNDKLLIKCTAIFLWFLELAYTICICHGVYSLCINDFGLIFDLLYTPIGLNTAVVIGSIIDHGVQAVFVARIYKATRALYIAIFLWILVALLQTLSLIIAAESITLGSIPLVVQKQRGLIMLLFFGDASLDIVNACVLCVYLKVKSQSAFSQSTTVLLDRLVVYTLQTGLVTSMVALAAAIAFKIAPESYFWTMFFMTMPGSFLSALLANMNNRQSVSQSRSPVSSSGAVVGQVTSIQFARNVVVSTMKSEDTNSPIDIEMKAPTESGAYAV